LFHDVTKTMALASPFARPRNISLKAPMEPKMVPANPMRMKGVGIAVQGREVYANTAVHLGPDGVNDSV